MPIGKRAQGLAGAAFVAAAALAPTPASAVYPEPIQARDGMVVTAQHLATDVGVAILKQGGNAIDAAVAVGYALAVVHPCCGNLGGGGFMTIHFADGRETFINFREKAPGRATATMYQDAKGNVVPGLSLDGYLAVGVPGTVKGLDMALQKYGTMSRETVMAPAIELASEGYVLTPGDAAILDSKVEAFQAQPNVADIFLEDGKPLAAGDRLVQSNLAQTLRAISRGGPDAFYKGPIAQAIVKASDAHGGILSLQDLESYTAEELKPVACAYRGYRVVSSPPPSSGGTTICETLRILEGYPMGFLGYHSAASVHYLVEALRHAFLDRNTDLGDPDFVTNPLDRLLSDEYAARIRATINPYRATPSAELKPGTPPHEGTQTTHYSIVDKAGNAVAVTYTINAYFGAKVIAGDTGFFLNDEMDDFTSKPGVPNMFGLVQGEANAIRPGKRPLSSMSPTIVTRDGKVFMVVGSPGGARIITITLEAILNAVDYGMDIQAAVDAPRIHHQWLPDKVYVEPMALSPDTEKVLTGMGYTIVEQAPWGAAEAIMVGRENEVKKLAAGGGDDTMRTGNRLPGLLYGANDDRRPAGKAAGF
jgi:gamma-glutamyltranspeptidase/glutathione hydrolase